MELRKAGRRLLDTLTRDGLGAGINAATKGFHGGMNSPAEKVLDFLRAGRLSGSDETGSVRVGPGRFDADKAAKPGEVSWGLSGGFGFAPTGDAVPGPARPGNWGMVRFGVGSNPVIPRGEIEMDGTQQGRNPLAARADWDEAAGRSSRFSVDSAVTPYVSPEVEPPSARDEMERVVREVREREKNPYWYRP